MQLITFRDTAIKIADDFLKERDMKLKKGRRKSFVIRDREAYQKGVEDSKAIDVRRKRINGTGDPDEVESEVMIKVEEGVEEDFRVKIEDVDE